VSLLLDALKRAEHEKHARPDPPQGVAAPAPIAGTSALELQPVARSVDPPPAARGVSENSAQVLAPAPARRRRAFAWIGAMVAVIAVAGVGGYIWYALEQLQPKRLARAVSPRPPPPPVATAQAPAAAVAPATPPPEPRAAPRPSPGTRAAASNSRLPTPAPIEPTPVLQPTQPAERARVPAEVAAGYEALRRGDLEAARRSYAAAAGTDLANLDATLGLATVEARSGRREQATALYRRSLEIDPRNATALAGLAAMNGEARPEALEESITRDIAEHPQSAALRYLLGNLHASQGRWSLAQAAYFEAYRLDSASPDILFNLAVSLDHLGQARPAADYYARALEAARSQPAAFDPRAVERRVAEIGQAR
jgi:tetratricopeptide (TPR) repeat protein